jgi:dual-specificity kinase
VPATSIVYTRFLDLLSKLLTWDPHQRITVKEALRHPYFALKIQDEGVPAE